jgi:hypothetical protein
MISPRPASCRRSAGLFSALFSGVGAYCGRYWSCSVIPGVCNFIAALLYPLCALLVLFYDIRCLRSYFCVPAISGVRCFGRLYISGLCTARVYYSHPQSGMCHACRAFYLQSLFALFFRPHSGWLCTVCFSSPRRSAAKHTVCVRCHAVATLSHATIALYALGAPASAPRSACIPGGILFFLIVHLPQAIQS